MVCTKIYSLSFIVAVGDSGTARMWMGTRHWCWQRQRATPTSVTCWLRKVLGWKFPGAATTGATASHWVSHHFSLSFHRANLIMSGSSSLRIAQIHKPFSKQFLALLRDSSESISDRSFQVSWFGTAAFVARPTQHIWFDQELKFQLYTLEQLPKFSLDHCCRQSKRYCHLWFTVFLYSMTLKQHIRTPLSEHQKHYCNIVVDHMPLIWSIIFAHVSTIKGL